MNVKSLSIVAGLITAFGSTAALAADAYITNQNMPAPVVTAKPYIAARVATVDEFQRNQYPESAVPSTLQRAQVVAEAIEARKLGLISDGERSVVPTAAQLAQVHLAGLQAVNSHVAAK